MNYIDPDIITQIFKLQPKGVNGIQVFIVGGISYGVEQQLMMYGFRTFRISGTNFLDTSAKVAEYLNYPENIMIVGVSSYPEDGNEITEIIEACDNALLTAKNLGKNRTFVCTKELV